MKSRLALLGILLSLSAGCSTDAIHRESVPELETGTVFGGPSTSELFAPYQGRWKLEDRIYDPPLDLPKLSGGPGISITGHIIQFGTDTLARELRLCQTRRTEDGLECTGWYHEDVYDPGDMQRADCKLSLKGDKLLLRWRVTSGGDYSDDPIIAQPDYVPPEEPASSSSPSWFVETYSRKVGSR